MDGDVLCSIARVCVHVSTPLLYNLTRCFNAREETSLRAPNNYVFSPDSLVMTVAQWYEAHSTPDYRDTYIVLPKHVQRKGKAGSKPYGFTVELYINIGQVWSTRLIMGSTEC